MTTQISLFNVDQSARQLLEDLLEAQAENEVHACLDRAELLDDENWRPYGDIENNGGSFLNQQASPRGALVEKIVNSIDAMLTAKAYESGDLPDSPPKTMFEATERYFSIPSGRLAEITATERGQIARDSVQVVVSGKRSPGKPTVRSRIAARAKPLSCSPTHSCPWPPAINSACLSCRGSSIWVRQARSVLWEGAQLSADSLASPPRCAGRQFSLGFHGGAAAPAYRQRTPLPVPVPRTGWRGYGYRCRVAPALGKERWKR